MNTFEQEFADYCGVKHGIGVASGTEALHLALVSCGIAQGDEVITVAHTAVATASAVSLTGAKPVLVDIDPEYFTIDPDCVKDAITARTKAIIPVHIYGQPADMDSVRLIAEENGLIVIEDCAQAHGAKYRGRRVGSLGEMGCFSFYPTKNLGAIGDGGMVVTDNSELADKVRLLREYGWKERFISSDQGWNSRLDEMQAGVLRVKLRYLDADNQKRVSLANDYLAGLANLPLGLPRKRDASDHVYHLFVIKTEDRASLQEYLKKEGIGTGIHYPVPIHQQDYFAKLAKYGSLKVTEKLSREIVSLPMYPELSRRESDTVIQTMQDRSHG